MIKCEVEKEIAVLSANGKKCLRLDLVSWNDEPATYDLRFWYESKPEGRLAGKGIIMTEEEVYNLHKALTEYFSS